MHHLPTAWSEPQVQVEKKENDLIGVEWERWRREEVIAHCHWASTISRILGFLRISFLGNLFYRLSGKPHCGWDCGTAPTCKGSESWLAWALPHCPLIPVYLSLNRHIDIRRDQQARFPENRKTRCVNQQIFSAVFQANSFQLCSTEGKGFSTVITGRGSPGLCGWYKRSDAAFTLCSIAGFF